VNRLFLGVVALVSFGVIATAYNPAPHSGGDNAGYISLAYSLLQDGSYRELYDPVLGPHTKYPPVFPALLAGLMLLGFRTWVSLKAIAALATVAAVALTYLWVERRVGPRWALGAALATALSSAVVYYSHWVLSDPAFLAFTLLSLYALDRADEDERAGWMALGVAAAGLAYFTRSAGLPLLVALAVWLLLRRRWGALAASALALGIPVALWWMRARAVGAGEYVTEFWMVNPYQPALGEVGYGGLGARFLTNLRGYVGTWLPGGIVGAQGAWVSVVGVAVTALGVSGWAIDARRRRGPSEIFLPLYAGLIFLWPEVWSGDRFALPLYPLLFGYGALFLKEGLARFGRTVPATVGGLALATLLVPATASWTGAVREASACNAAARAGGPFACWGPGVTSFVEAAAWAGANLPDSAVVFSRKPRIFYVMSGVPSRTFPFDTNHWVLLTEADVVRARYVLLDEWDGLAMQYVGSAVRGRPGSFCSVRGFGERTQLLGILPAGSGAAAAAAAGGVGVRIMPCPPDFVTGDGSAAYSSSSSRIPLLDGLEP
jgi:4-amino-4-deoxy-L-arabinose transferase-like glycosyltransferase